MKSEAGMIWLLCAAGSIIRKTVLTPFVLFLSPILVYSNSEGTARAA
jgi:hypothetical protein